MIYAWLLVYMHYKFSFVALKVTYFARINFFFFIFLCRLCNRYKNGLVVTTIPSYTLTLIPIIIILLRYTSNFGPYLLWLCCLCCCKHKCHPLFLFLITSLFYSLFSVGIFLCVALLISFWNLLLCSLFWVRFGSSYSSIFMYSAILRSFY
jgi:hypothetical protein